MKSPFFIINTSSALIHATVVQTRFIYSLTGETFKRREDAVCDCAIAWIFFLRLLLNITPNSSDKEEEEEKSLELLTFHSQPSYLSQEINFYTTLLINIFNAKLNFIDKLLAS